MPMINLRLAIACLLATAASWACATPAIESRPVNVVSGGPSVTSTGTLKGDQIVDYVLRAQAGQTLSVSLTTDHLANYFNVLPPGSKDVALFIGSTQGNDWSHALSASGDYTVRVYLMRSAARRHEIAHFTLVVGLTGSTEVTNTLGMAPVSDARVPGTVYHATGELPCSMGHAPPGSARCRFGVIRGTVGRADVHVTPPGGFERVLRFIDGQVSAPGSAKVDAHRHDDGWWVDVNDHEHYQVPDAVILGG